ENLMLQVLGGAAHVRGDLDAARARYAESAALSEQLGDGRLGATAIGYRAMVEIELGDLDAARAHLRLASGAAGDGGAHGHGALFRASTAAASALSGRVDEAEAILARARETLAEHSDPKIERAVDVLAALPPIVRGARAEAEAILERAVAPRGGLDPVASSADVRIALRIARSAMDALEQAREADRALCVDP